mmetsp:Transcript_31571/g.75042  ORF Transcript_31571/g.75042 Transcript_31571/m.75042 type:complete len:368 (-) Transcript_31571:424-1527(-)
MVRVHLPELCLLGAAEVAFDLLVHDLRVVRALAAELLTAILVAHPPLVPMLCRSGCARQHTRVGRSARGLWRGQSTAAGPICARAIAGTLTAFPKRGLPCGGPDFPRPGGAACIAAWEKPLRQLCKRREQPLPLARGPLRARTRRRRGRGLCRALRPDALDKDVHMPEEEQDSGVPCLLGPRRQRSPGLGATREEGAPLRGLQQLRPHKLDQPRAHADLDAHQVADPLDVDLRGEGFGGEDDAGGNHGGRVPVLAGLRRLHKVDGALRQVHRLGARGGRGAGAAPAAPGEEARALRRDLVQERPEVERRQPEAENVGDRLALQADISGGELSGRRDVLEYNWELVEPRCYVHAAHRSDVNVYPCGRL